MMLAVFVFSFAK